MCCVAGLPMQIGLNQLIHKARPDRLLIEPTGLGHPSQIIETLTGEHYQDVLQLGPVLCLVDPRRLEEQKVLENVQFQDQVAAADIVIANKTDLCTPEQVARFDHWVAEQQPGKTAVFHTRQGRLESAWLDRGDRALRGQYAPRASSPCLFGSRAGSRYPGRTVAAGQQPGAGAFQRGLACPSRHGLFRNRSAGIVAR